MSYRNLKTLKHIFSLDTSDRVVEFTPAVLRANLWLISRNIRDVHFEAVATY